MGQGFADLRNHGRCLEGEGVSWASTCTTEGWRELTRETEARKRGLLCVWNVLRIGRIGLYSECFIGSAMYVLCIYLYHVLWIFHKECCVCFCVSLCITPYVLCTGSSRIAEPHTWHVPNKGFSKLAHTTRNCTWMLNWRFWILRTLL